MVSLLSHGIQALGRRFLIILFDDTAYGYPFFLIIFHLPLPNFTDTCTSVVSVLDIKCVYCRIKTSRGRFHVKFPRQFPHSICEVLANRAPLHHSGNVPCHSLVMVAKLWLLWLWYWRSFHCSKFGFTCHNPLLGQNFILLWPWKFQPVRFSGR